jgi:hypothetical protein
MSAGGELVNSEGRSSAQMQYVFDFPIFFQIGTDTTSRVDSVEEAESVPLDKKTWGEKGKILGRMGDAFFPIDKILKAVISHGPDANKSLLTNE